MTESRRRSRPVEKKSSVKKIKRNKPAMLLAIFMVFILVVAGLYALVQSSGDDTSSTEEGYSQEILDAIAGSEYPVGVIQTSKGDIAVELYNDKTPITCTNFINLAKEGFYNKLVFHRIIDGFMIQGGGFDTNGNQQTSPYGTIELEIDQDLRHVDGAIAMARQGPTGMTDPAYFNTATSQFYICDGAQSGLNDYYCVFGKVIEGMQVVRDISAVETGTNDWPKTDIIINTVEIFNE